MSNSSPRKTHLGRRVAVLAVSVVFILAGAVCLYGNNLLSHLNMVNTGAASRTPVTASNVDSGTTFTTSGANQVNGLLTDEAITNVLILGLDDYQKDDPYGRSDSMMLVSIDQRHKKLKVTSIMRDVFVNMGDNGCGKLNAAYHYGAIDSGAAGGSAKSVTAGAMAAVSTIEEYFGMRIDRFVTVSDSAFNEIIDALGGLELTLTQEEADYISMKTEGDVIATGKTKLVGYQVHWYSRIRSEEPAVPNIYGNVGDTARAERQRLVFSSIISTLQGNLGALNTIASEVLPKVFTNYDINSILGLITQAPTLLGYSIEQAQTPVDGEDSTNVTYPTYGDVIRIDDLDAMRSRILTFIYEDDKPATLSKASQNAYTTTENGTMDNGGVLTGTTTPTGNQSY